MSTTINPLELYVNGSQVYPGTGMTVDFSSYGYVPWIITEINANRERIIDNGPHRNFNDAQVDPNWPVYYPELTSEQMTQMGQSGERWNWRGQCYNYVNVIDLSAGIEGSDDPESWPSGLQRNRCWALTFTGQLPEDPDNPGYTDTGAKCLLYDCGWCTTIEGLDLSNVVWLVDDDHEGGFKRFFQDNRSLADVDITWPTYFTGLNHESMFAGCYSFPDDALPDIVIQDPGLNSNNDQLYVNCHDIFCDCHLLETSHIDDSSFAYISDLSGAWARTAIEELDLPSTTNPDVILTSALADDYQLKKVVIEANINNITSDITNHRFITPESMWTDDPDDTIKYDFVQNFDGIYVPDADIADWQDCLANFDTSSDWAVWTRSKIYGLSDL